MMIRVVAVCAVALGLVACGSRKEPAPSGTAAIANPDSLELARITGQYYERWLALNPLAATARGDHRYDAELANTASEAWMADSLAAEQDALEALRRIDPAHLDASDRITYETFRYGREIAFEGYRYPSELLPINQFSSLATQFAELGAGTGAHPFATAADYDHFLARMDGFVRWVDQVIANLRVGIDKGIVLPKVVVEATLPQLEEIGVEDPRQSLFWRPILSFPAGMSVADRRRLTDAYARALGENVLPAYRRLHDYLEDEYLPHARDRVGWSELPAGDVWYGYLARAYTTTKLEPAEIHALGLKEVARLRGEMERAAAQLGHHGDLRAFFDSLRGDPRFRVERPETLLEGYGALRDRVNLALPVLFAVRPKSGFEIRAVESYRARSAAAASYEAGSADGSRPGIFYVNTYDLPSRPTYLMQAIYLHEAVPGHHFQTSIAQEAGRLPPFRRFAREPAYVEGWGVYAETLGPELGLYDDPYSRFGALTLQAWRAARLVVDTGLHSQGWSRQRAIEYLRANTSLGESDVRAEVDRYIAMPGQALAYKIGQLKIAELRLHAQQRLGARFDPRAFHTAILADGPLPLAVLEAKMGRWIAAQAQRGVP
jgi:uncharacterized protein (DUF885 family)